MKQTYPSRKDPLIIALLGGPVLLLLGYAVYLIATGETSPGIILFLSTALVAALIVAFAWPCYYTINGRILEIRAGLIKDRIDIAHIKTATKEWGTTAAPALSFHRVRLTNRVGLDKVVSPVDRDGFIETIQQIQRTIQSSR